MASQQDFFEKTLFRDFPLIVEERQIFINRGFLAELSPAFMKMFFGPFKEALPGVTEVPLPGKSLDDILDLMATIFWWPQPKPVSVENAELILQLADEYEIDSLLQAAIKVIQKQMTSAPLGCTGIVHWARLCFQYPHCFSANWPTLFTKISHENLLALLDLAQEKGAEAEHLKDKCLNILDRSIAESTGADALLKLLVASNRNQLQSRMAALVPKVARLASAGQLQKFYPSLDAGVIAALLEAKVLRMERLIRNKTLVFAHDDEDLYGFGTCMKCKFCNRLDVGRNPVPPCPNRLSSFQCSNYSKNLMQK